MEAEEPNEIDEVKFTPWDRRVISAMNVAEGARVGVLILRIGAAVTALFTIVGGALSYFSDFTSDEGPYPARVIDRQTVGSYLANLASPLAFAGIVLALSYLIQISAARLDIDIVLSDAEESESNADD